MGRPLRSCERYLLVIPAAGTGTRALKLTGYGAIQKAFVNAGEDGATVMDCIMKEADDTGIHDVLFVVGSEDDRSAFERFFRPLLDESLFHKLLEKIAEEAREEMVCDALSLADIDASLVAIESLIRSCPLGNSFRALLEALTERIEQKAKREARGDAKGTTGGGAKHGMLGDPSETEARALAEFKQLVDLCKFNIHYALQEQPTGFGDAVSLATGLMTAYKAFAGVVVALADDFVYSGIPAMQQLVSAYEIHKNQKMVVAVQRVERSEAHRYGIVRLGEKLEGDFTNSERFTGRAAYVAQKVREKPKTDEELQEVVSEGGHFFAVVGRYVLRPEDIEDLAKTAIEPATNSKHGASWDGRRGRKEHDFAKLLEARAGDGCLTAVELDGEWLTVGSPSTAVKAYIRNVLGQATKRGESGKRGEDYFRYTLEVIGKVLSADGHGVDGNGEDSPMLQTPGLTDELRAALRRYAGAQTGPGVHDGERAGGSVKSRPNAEGGSK